jgi:hypothetical protein
MEQIFNLKFTSKQLVRGSKRAEKDEKAEKLKVKKAIEKGNIDGAKIYAQARVAASTPHFPLALHEDACGDSKITVHLPSGEKTMASYNGLTGLHPSVACLRKSLNRSG